MSITKRFVDLAKSNLNSLLEKAAETADPRRRLSNLSDAELEAELERRRSMREGEAAVNAARARVDAPEPEKPAAAVPSPANGAKPVNGAATGAASDREARAQAAREREARVKAARDQREREARAKDEAAAAQIRARAQQAAQAQAQARAKSASPPPNGSAGGAARKAPRNADPMVVQYYARLEVTYGASWDEVKVAYRKLMRRYHPDLHAHSPEKLKAATEVSQALTQAYNELDKILNQ